MSIRTVLVANRGQVARRILRTAREMGMRTVAVYAEEDRLAPHVAEADVAVPLGAGSTAEAYRNRRAILDAAAWQGADAIHPGHGHLAANAAFAQAVLDAGHAWVGPSPEVARLTADELARRQRAAVAEVPTLDGVVLAGDEGLGWTGTVDGLGYPLVVAGAAGVEGRLRWLVRDAAGLRAAIDAARRGGQPDADGTVVVERLVPGARLVDVPVLADGQGGVVTLTEIDRLTVRRRRTALAVSPSPGIDESGRERLLDAAGRFVVATGLRGLASVLALVRGEDLWVLELIPMLPLGHPVTEVAHDVDLVRAQLALAAGEALPPALTGARPAGHTVCAHVRALGTGTLHDWRHGPTPGVRHDDAVTAGTVIGAADDPLLSTLTARATTREEATARLGRALRELHIHGVDADRDELVDVLADDEPPAEDDPARYERDWQRFNALIGPHLAAAALADPARHATRSPVWPFAPTGWRNVGGSVHEMRPGETTWRITPTHSGFASQAIAFEHQGQRWDVSYNRVQRDHPLAVRRRRSLQTGAGDLFNVTIGGPSGHTTTIVELIPLDEEVTLVHFGRRGHRCRVHVVGDHYFVNSALGQTELRELPRVGR